MGTAKLLPSGLEHVKKIEYHIDGHVITFYVLEERVKDGELSLALPWNHNVEPPKELTGGIMGLEILNPQVPVYPELKISEEGDALIRRAISRHLEKVKEKKAAEEAALTEALP